MFGASPSKPNACVTMAGASRNRVGSVWTDSLPARPPEASKAGIRSGAARTLISATIAHASSRSDRSECSPASSRTRDAQRVGILLPDVDHDRRIGGRADGAEADGVLELVDGAAVVPDVGRRLGHGSRERAGGQRLHRSLRVDIGGRWGARVPRCNRLHGSGLTQLGTAVQRLSGAQIIAEFLVRAGVTHAAGIPGHGVWTLTDALLDRPEIRTVQVMHEQSAVHLADGYYRASGTPMLAFTSIGPGATNTVIGMATAYVDSTAVALFTGSTHTYMRGHGVLQELERRHHADNPRIFEPVVKEWWQPSRRRRAAASSCTAPGTR